MFLPRIWWSIYLEIVRVMLYPYQKSKIKIIRNGGINDGENVPPQEKEAQ